MKGINIGSAGNRVIVAAKTQTISNVSFIIVRILSI